MLLRHPLAPALASCLARAHRNCQRVLFEVERGQRALQQDLAQLRRGQLLPPAPLCPTEGASFRAALAGERQGVILWMLHEANYLRLLLGLGAALGAERQVTVLRARRHPQERTALEASARALGVELTVLEGAGQSRALLRALRRGAVVVLLGDALPGMHDGPVASQPVLGRPLPFSTGPFRLATRGPYALLPLAFLPRQGAEGGLSLVPGPALAPGAKAQGAAAGFFRRWLVQAPERWLLWHRFLTLPSNPQS